MSGADWQKKVCSGVFLVLHSPRSRSERKSRERKWKGRLMSAPTVFYFATAGSTA
jgi:hypothetical protein